MSNIFLHAKGASCMQRARLISGMFSVTVLLSLSIILARVAFPTVSIFGPQAQWSTLDTFQGSGNKNTSGFLVPAQWRIAWSCAPASSPIRRYNVIVEVKRSAELLSPFAATELAVNTFCTNAQRSGTKDESGIGTASISVISEGQWMIDIQAPK